MLGDAAILSRQGLSGSPGIPGVFEMPLGETGGRDFSPLSLLPAFWLSDTGNDANIWPDISGNNRHATGGSGGVVIAQAVRQIRRHSISPNRYAIPNVRTSSGGCSVFIVSQRASNQLVGGTFQRLFSMWNGVTADDYIAPSYSVAAPFGANGVPVAYSPRISVGISSNAVLQNIKIGGNSAFTGQEYSGDIAEILVIPRAVTLAERQQVERYLRARWAILA